MIKIEKDFKRPWGGFIKFVDNKPCTVKILCIKKGGSLSLQSHKMRQEFWYVISGKVQVIVGPNPKRLKSRVLKEGQYIKIAKKILHRAKAVNNSQILEISTGKFKEKDETRYEDAYGRN